MQGNQGPERLVPQAWEPAVLEPALGQFGHWCREGCFGGGWVASLDTCTSSALPTLALWPPLRSQHSVWPSLRSCFSVAAFQTFPLSRRPAFLPGCVSAQLDCTCAEHPEQQGSGADKETPSDHQLPHSTVDAQGCMPLACWAPVTHQQMVHSLVWAHPGPRLSVGKNLPENSKAQGEVERVHWPRPASPWEWDGNHGRALSRC